MIMYGYLHPKVVICLSASIVLINSENKNISNGFCSSLMGFMEFYDLKKLCELFCLKPSIFSESKKKKKVFGMSLRILP